MEIQRMMVLSTAHVRPETAAILEHAPLEDWPVTGGHYGGAGWMLYAHDDDAERNIPSELMRAFGFARSHGCNYVLFDRDAETVDALETFEW